MMQPHEVEEMKRIFQASVKYHDEQKKKNKKYIPASDARLKAMAITYLNRRGTNEFYEIDCSLFYLRDYEREKFNAFLDYWKEKLESEKVTGEVK